MPDNDMVGVIVSGSLLVVVLASFIVFFIVSFRRKQILHLKEKEQMQLAFERDAAKARLEIVENTMKRISQEVHDNIGQLLTLAKLQYGSATRDNFEEHFTTGNNLVSRAIHDLRNLARSLNGNYILENGLVNSIRRECEVISESGEIRASFFLQGEHPELNPNEEVILFRCVQEALNNAVKHSGCDAVQVRMHYGVQGLRVVVEDNGRGLETGARDGVGMKSLHERMTALKGEFILQSGSGAGTSVSLFIPPASIENNAQL